MTAQTLSRLFPRPKTFEQRGRARRFDPAAGVLLRTAGPGDFARSREVIADELRKAFPQVNFTDNTPWELRLSLGFTRPEPEAYHLTVAGRIIAITGSTWRGLLCGWATLRQLLDPENRAAPTLRDTEITDWPDIRCRAASRWLVLLEGSGMASTD